MKMPQIFYTYRSLLDNIKTFTVNIRDELQRYPDSLASVGFSGGVTKTIYDFTASTLYIYVIFLYAENAGTGNESVAIRWTPDVGINEILRTVRVPPGSLVNIEIAFFPPKVWSNTGDIEAVPGTNVSGVVEVHGISV